MDWDAPRVSYSDPAAVGVAQQADDRASAKAQFREFIRTFHLAGSEVFPYRQQLLQNWRKGHPVLEVDLGDVGGYRPELLAKLQARPTDFLPLFEQGAKEALMALNREGAPEEELPDIQVVLKSGQEPTPLRRITAGDINHLLKVPGIVISASRIRSKATAVTIKCKACGTTKVLHCAGAFGGVQLPNSCDGGASAIGSDGVEACPQDPFVVLPDKSVYVDQQTLKLQEAPEVVPTGEMPRNVLLTVDRHLVDRVSPGTRVSVLGISSVFNSAKNKVGAVAIRTPFLRAVGFQVSAEGAGRSAASFTPAEEEQFRAMAADPLIYQKMAQSIAPAISGDYTKDIKCALACLLFGGSRKMLPDGMKLRGDINVLLMGDPSTAKSQFLKFIEKVAPVGVYTSGKGSSAAGLTASVIKDARGEFFLEGGAMVLADGGVVCIDEFDKMRETDRVAIHEAMEQQTISVAKAGLTTVLNARSSVLAAANPIYGRYDDLKSCAENIDLMTTILSRFDLIFIVRDIRDEAKDRSIARHVMGVHINATAADAGVEEGEIDIATMKRFILYCRSRCAPRLSAAAEEVLRSQYVKVRDTVKQRERDSDESHPVPITVRQLEALIRISEALAKMTLSRQATAEHAQEALRLFKVSTMSAANSGGGSPEASLTPEVRQEVERVEELMRKRIGHRCTVSARKLLDQFAAQGHSGFAVRKAIFVMVQRQELVYRQQRRLLYRP